jgi:hypothetical protein
VAVAFLTAGAALYAIAPHLAVAGGGMSFASFGSALATMAGGGLNLAGAIVAGAAGGFASGFAGSLLNGGSLSDAFKAGMIGGVVGGITGGLAYGIGSLHEAGAIGSWEKVFAHGTVQGAAAEAQGGQFRHGFYSGFATAAASPYIPAKAGWVGAAVVGGTASALGGGKFANGAVSGAFQYLLNHSQHEHDGDGSLWRELGSFALDCVPLVGSGKSILELISGKDYVTGESTSRLLAAGGIVAGIVPGGKGVLKGGVKISVVAKTTIKQRYSEGVAEALRRKNGANVTVQRDGVDLFRVHKPDSGHGTQVTQIVRNTRPSDGAVFPNPRDVPVRRTHVEQLERALRGDPRYNLRTLKDGQ